MKKLLFYKFLFVLLFGCGEYDELENSETEYVNFNFILNENEINLSSNLNLSYFNDITIGVKENSDNYISLITAQSNQTIEISCNKFRKAIYFYFKKWIKGYSR